MLECSTEITRKSIASAVKRLRLALGHVIPAHDGEKEKTIPMPQDQFGALFDHKVSSVQRWEGEQSIPPGDAIIKMLLLCPDRETFNAFGVKVPAEKKMEKENMCDRKDAYQQRAKRLREAFLDLAADADSGNHLAKKEMAEIAAGIILSAGMAVDDKIDKRERKRAISSIIRKLNLDVDKKKNWISR